MSDELEIGADDESAGRPRISPITRRSLLGGAALALTGVALAACETGGTAATGAGTTTTESLLGKVQKRGTLNITNLTGDAGAILLTDNGSAATLDGAYALNSPVIVSPGTTLNLNGSWSNASTLTW